MRSILIALTVLWAAAPAAAQSVQAYRSEAGFVLDLPAHWVRAPERTLAAMARPASPDIVYEAVFGVTDAPVPTPPFAVVARQDLPEPTTRQAFAASFRSADPQAEVQEALDETPMGRAGARAGVPMWEAASGIAWVRADLPSNGTSPTFVWAALTLAPSGRAIVTIMYYGREGTDEAAMRAEVRSILRTLRED